MQLGSCKMDNLICKTGDVQIVQIDKQPTKDDCQISGKQAVNITQKRFKKRENAAINAKNDKKQHKTQCFT